MATVDAQRLALWRAFFARFLDTEIDNRLRS
jgi:hypothetical protein